MPFHRLLIAIAGYAILVQPAAGASGQALPDVCKNLTHCITILETHGPESFDYGVLRGELARYGSKGVDGLILMIESEDPELISRAMKTLAGGQFRFSPADQRIIVAAWPSVDRRSHAAVMGTIMSPLVRAKAIDTLFHPDEDVRLLSRSLLENSVDIDFPMRAKDYVNLARAAVDNPTSGLVKLLAKFPPEQAGPVLVRVLRSGNADAVSAAYEGLYAADKEQAFKALVGVIQDLKPDESPAALAIADMLRRRHETRTDGFYMKFAKDLSEDADLGPAGRAVGYDMLMRSQGPSKPKMKDSQKGRASFDYIMSSHSASIDPYIDYLQTLNDETSDSYLASVQTYLESRKTHPTYDNSDWRALLAIAHLKTPFAKILVERGLLDQKDYKVIGAAVIAASKQKQSALRPAINSILENHPITDVRAAASIALAEFNKPTEVSANTLYASLQSGFDLRASRQLNSLADYCSVAGYDFNRSARSMPLFDDAGMLAQERPALRQWLSSASELKSGWLGGYNEGRADGGLIYYDYDSGPSKPLINDNVIAIIPKRRLPLGQYPQAFWIITDQHQGVRRQGRIYHAAITPAGFEIVLHATLPDKPSQIEWRQDNSVIIDFVPRKMSKSSDKRVFNPPLKLSPNGGISRACGTKRAGSLSKKATP